MAKYLFRLSLLIVSLVISPGFAAIPVNLAQQNISFLKNMLPQTKQIAGNLSGIQEENKSVDFNQTTHIRIHQQYNGYPIHGGEAILHIPGNNKMMSLAAAINSPAQNISMNGVIYKDLDKDLQNAPPYIFNQEQAGRALKRAIAEYKNKVRNPIEIKNQKSELLVYIDNNNQAHWAFRVSFYVEHNNGFPAMPVYFLDALTFQIYQEWNDVKTLENVEGGGYGGNIKIGKLIYDGTRRNLSKLQLQRDTDKKMCLLNNDDVTVVDFRTKEIASFNCIKPDPAHNNLFWNDGVDNINGAYSPNNDALYAGKVIKDMYQNWYGIPVLAVDNKPIKLEMVTHAEVTDIFGNIDYDNAAWNSDEKKMYFGDGKDVFYPLTSLSVAAHEISHGFTEQDSHSRLEYFDQSGGINEAFSDMAAQAAEFYTTNKNSWKIGAEITLKSNAVLRYLDKPSKDCENQSLGNNNCSIDNARDYKPNLNVHFSSGVFNRAFYLLSTSSGWNVKKAFNVMVQANRHYWRPKTNFVEGACGVISAAKDYKYDLKAVSKAFRKVGIETKDC